MRKGNAEVRGRELARNVWLAGLGLVAAVGDEASTAFASLVKEGRRVERRERAVVDDLLRRARGRVEAVRRRTVGLRERAEHEVRGAMAAVLHRFGVPSRDDITALQALLERLGARVNDLAKVN